MDIIDDRYNKSSTILSSQTPVSAWYDIIGERTIGDAILEYIKAVESGILLEPELK